MTTRVYQAFLNYRYTLCSQTSRSDSLVIYSGVVMGMTPGQRFRQAVTDEKPLQCVGAINAFHARLVDTSPCMYQEAVLRLVPVVFQIWVLQHSRMY